MKNHYSTPSSERAFLAEGWPRQDLVYKAQLLALSVLEVLLEVLERFGRTRAFFPDSGHDLPSGTMLAVHLAEPGRPRLLDDNRLPIGFLRRRLLDRRLPGRRFRRLLGRRHRVLATQRRETSRNPI